MELQKHEIQNKSASYSKSAYVKFLLPSVIGVLLFLVPVFYKGKWTIGVGVFAETVQASLASTLPLIMTMILFLSVVLTIVAKWLKPNVIMSSPFLKGLFDVQPFWFISRILGFVFALMTYMKWGPEIIWSDFTGGTVLYALIPVLMTWFLFAALLMPLLMDFGLMDFIGTLVRDIMRPVFKLPGRSSVDALASWMGSGTVGVLITTKQFEEGYYTKREAAVIATNFSVASIAFSLVIIQFINLEHMFVPFYVTVVVAGIVAAIICPRIPPLSRKKDEYYEPVGQKISEEVPSGVTKFQWAVDKAVEKASEVKSAGQVIKKSIVSVIDIYFGLIPLVMALGTIALILAEYTPIFSILSYPFVPILELLQLPEASKAAPAMLVGFADMFLPAVIGSGIESEITRFVIAVMSLTQLIYMSEIGVLLLKSKIPISFFELFVIFLQRTIITLPIVTVMAYMFF